MQDYPLVSVIVLNYNGLKYLGEGLKECLDSVLRTDYPNFEVIFVDNGSTDLSTDFVKENYGSTIKVVRNESNLGFSEGFNTGMRSSKGKYLALLSNDMTVDPNWLDTIIKIMETEPKTGLAGFKRLVYGTKDLLDGIGGNLYLCGRVKLVGTNEMDRGQYNALKTDMDYIGGAMVLRRKTLKDAGLFDPSYIIFSEDCDLCYRIRKCGYETVYVPAAIIWHRAHGTLDAMDPRGTYLNYMSERSRIRFVLIHFTRMRVLSAFLIDLIWFSVTNIKGKKALVKAYWWNLKNIGTTLKIRFRYRPSPQIACKSPFIPFKLSSLIKRVRGISTHHTEKPPAN